MRGAGRLVKRHAKIWVPLIILALIGAGFGIYKDLNGPVIGSLSQSAPKPAAKVAPAAPVMVSGKYISFSRPAGYTPITGDKLSDALLENFAYANRTLLPPTFVDAATIQPVIPTQENLSQYQRLFYHFGNFVAGQAYFPPSSSTPSGDPFKPSLARLEFD